MRREVDISMRILFDIGHPAHIHLFKNVAWTFQKQGNPVLFTVRDKEITLYLLRTFEFDFSVVGNNQKNIFKKLLNMAIVDYRMLKVVKDFRPDVLVSQGSMYAAQVARFCGIPHIAFEDSEHAWEQHALYVPFTDIVCSPKSFKKSFGKKHIKYNGIDELTYLHPRYFRPNPSLLAELGLSEKDRIILIRFASWDASHDIGKKGFDFKNKNEMVSLVSWLEKYGKVFITTEIKLPAELQDRVLKLAPEKIHDFLYYCTLYMGEGATIAAEAAVMGTPSLYVSTLPLGYINDLRDKYGLVEHYDNLTDAKKAAERILSNPNVKNEWRSKTHKLLNENIDVTAFIVDVITRVYKKEDLGKLKTTVENADRTDARISD